MMDRKHCHGCRDDFYNGNNPMGVKACWGLKTATRIRRVRVNVDKRPPWTAKSEWLPSCYNEDRFVFFKVGDPILMAANELHANTDEARAKETRAST